MCASCAYVNESFARAISIGKAFFKLLHDAGDEPVIMTRDIVVSTDQQFWAHLLCDECEGRFSKFGEDYTMMMVQRNNSESDFRLLNLIKLSRVAELPRPRPDIPYVAYPGREMGIKTDELAYFALSVIWRLAAHNWPTLNGQKTTLDLGAFYEPIRLFLLGEGPFPADLHVAATAASDGLSRLCYILPERVTGLPWQQIGFLARGIWFDITMGENQPQELLDRCCVTSPKKVIYLANCEPRTLQAAGSMTANARVARNVKM